MKQRPHIPTPDLGYETLQAWFSSQGEDVQPAHLTHGPDGFPGDAIFWECHERSDRIDRCEGISLHTQRQRQRLTRWIEQSTSSSPAFDIALAQAARLTPVAAFQSLGWETDAPPSPRIGVFVTCDPQTASEVLWTEAFDAFASSSTLRSRLTPLIQRGDALRPISFGSFHGGAASSGLRVILRGNDARDAATGLQATGLLEAAEDILPLLDSIPRGSDVNIALQLSEESAAWALELRCAPELGQSNAWVPWLAATFPRPTAQQQRMIEAVLARPTFVAREWSTAVALESLLRDDDALPRMEQGISHVKLAIHEGIVHRKLYFQTRLRWLRPMP